MRKGILPCLVLTVCALLAPSAIAKDSWPLTVRVLSTKNLEDPHGSFHFTKVFGDASAAWSHRVAEHVFVEASDGISYELVPQNPKDMLLPGTFQARIEKRDMKVCEPKDNGDCRDVKFKIVTAVPTVDQAKEAPEQPEPMKAPDPVAGAQASVTIESTPPGADIAVDGGFVGDTPSTVSVAPGAHEITVSKKGFADWSRKLNVTGGSIHLDAELDASSPTPAPSTAPAAAPAPAPPQL